MTPSSDKERILARMAVRTLNREGYPKDGKRPNLVKRTAWYVFGTIVVMICILIGWAKGEAIDDFFTSDIQKDLVNYGWPIFLLSGLILFVYLKRKR